LIIIGETAPELAPTSELRSGHAGRQVDPRLRLALPLLLHARHEGAEHAATWEQLRDELQAEGLQVKAVRRLQECAEQLLEDEGLPIVGLSETGIFWAVTAGEVERALRQAEKRARKTLRRRRLLRRAWLQLKGQEDLPAIEGTAA
jgi:hypothetical protein